MTYKDHNFTRIKRKSNIIQDCDFICASPQQMDREIPQNAILNASAFQKRPSGTYLPANPSFSRKSHAL
jgi:hypothetical protein